MTKYKMVSVSWVDSQVASFTWCHVDEIQQEIAMVETVGFLILETKEILTIAGSVSEKEDSVTSVSSVINIPKCCIKRRKIISS
jgi:hypothetical protein